MPVWSSSGKPVRVQQQGYMAILFFVLDIAN